MPIFKANWWTNPPSSVKYAVTLVSVASAVIIAWVLWHFWHSEAFASVFFCAIIFSAWFGGLQAGFARGHVLCSGVQLFLPVPDPFILFRFAPTAASNHLRGVSASN